MQGGRDELPPVPPWFATEVLAMLALYPSAQAGKATVAAWWRKLHALPREALLYGFAKAPEACEDKRWPPSAIQVLDHARAWRPPTPRANLDRPALPEPEPELPPELREIRSAQKRGEMSPGEASRAFVRWLSEKLA